MSPRSTTFRPYRERSSRLIEKSFNIAAICTTSEGDTRALEPYGPAAIRAIDATGLMLLIAVKTEAKSNWTWFGVW